MLATNHCPLKTNEFYHHVAAEFHRDVVEKSLFSSKMCWESIMCVESMSKSQLHVLEAFAICANHCVPGFDPMPVEHVNPSRRLVMTVIVLMPTRLKVHEVHWKHNQHTPTHSKDMMPLPSRQNQFNDAVGNESRHNVPKQAHSGCGSKGFGQADPKSNPHKQMP